MTPKSPLAIRRELLRVRTVKDKRRKAGDLTDPDFLSLRNVKNLLTLALIMSRNGADPITIDTFKNASRYIDFPKP